MNFVKLYIGDYMRDTGTLSVAEHGAYMLMLLHHYATEAPLPKGQELYRLVRAVSKAEREAVDSVVAKFWTDNGTGLVNNRACQEIERAAHQRAVNQAVGKRGGRPKRTEQETESVSEPEPIRNPNQTPDYSVPKGTGGTPGVEEQTKAELWAAGASLLEQQGMPKAQCRSFVGKLVKDHGQQIVVDAVRTAVVNRPADAAQYLVAVCRRESGLRKGPVTVPSKAAEETIKYLASQTQTPEQRAAAEEARRRVMSAVRRVS